MSFRVFRGGHPAELSPLDRGLAYGDGLFETMRVHRHAPVWWPRHWSRLRRGAEALDIALPDEDWLERACMQLIAEDACGEAVLKLVITRGEGERGYRQSAGKMPTIIVSLQPLPGPVCAPVRLRWCTLPLSAQPALAGIKHLNRLEQVLARAEWNDPMIFDGLMCDFAGRVVCATSANVFARLDGRWLTPRLQDCGVAGTTRAWVLESVAGSAVADLRAGDVVEAEAVFVCNALRGILAVGELDERRWDDTSRVAQVASLLARQHPAFRTQEP